MLTVLSDKRSKNCEGSNRRDFLRVGSLGFAGFTLANLLKSRAEAKLTGSEIKNKSVIWVWLSGGPTHVETFDPKITAPVEYRSITGEAATPIPGMSFGGTFPKLAAVGDKMAVVRSFAHGDSSHGSATVRVMTGYNDRNGTRPSTGSIVARVRGTTHPITGMPTYMRMGSISGDGPGFLGTTYSAFDPAGQARKNMTVQVASDRFESRRELLNQIDTINRKMDRSGKMEGLDGFEQQAFELILGSSQDAFDISKVDAKTRAMYGPGLGESLLQARRLCEAGCGLVTINYGGWDMHGRIQAGLQSRSPQLDQGVSALITDLDRTGLLEDTLVVVTGEFGRTPKINAGAGRDHWGRLCTLALAGGGLRMGQVIGESSAKAEVPNTAPISPQDLMATILHMCGIDYRLQIVNNSGRPTYLVEDGKPIAELI